MRDDDLDTLLAYVSTHYLAPAIKQAYDRLKHRASASATQTEAEIAAVRAELLLIKARNMTDAPYF